MVKNILIALTVLFLMCYVLYRIGKKVKEKEKMILHQFEVRKRLSEIANKRKRQSTPKVPKIKKQ